MLHTPLKHAQVAPAHPSPSHTVPLNAGRCNTHLHPNNSHELNLSDWLHVSPNQVAMMSPARSSASPTSMHSFSPQHGVFVQSHSPLQYNQYSPPFVSQPYPHTGPQASFAPAQSSSHLVAEYQMHMQLPVPLINVEDVTPQPHTPYTPPSYQHATHQPGHHMNMGLLDMGLQRSQPQHSQEQLALNASDDASLLLSFAEYIQFSANTQSAGPSPVLHSHSHVSPSTQMHVQNQPHSCSVSSPLAHSHDSMHNHSQSRLEGESSTLTTLSGSDHIRNSVSPQTNVKTTFVDLLRAVSPVTEANASGAASPVPARNSTESKVIQATGKGQQNRKPVESAELPFKLEISIAAPQPRSFNRTHSSLPTPQSPHHPSSRPTSSLGMSPLSSLSPLSELAELASQRSTPALGCSGPASPGLLTPASATFPASRPLSRISRPSSALSISSHVPKSSSSKRKGSSANHVPHRFPASRLQVSLPTSNVGLADAQAALARRLCGPLEFDNDGLGYRTRARAKCMKAEIQERERQLDLALIRRGLRGPTPEEEKSVGGLEMLASVSMTRCVTLDLDLESDIDILKTKSTTAAKKGVKRPFKDVDTDDVASESGMSEVRRTPSKRARYATEKAKSATSSQSKSKNAKPEEKPAATSSKAKNNNTSRVKDTKKARPSPARSSSNSKKAGSKQGLENKDMEVDIDAEGEVEDELTSLSSMSDMDYEPEKKKSGSKSVSSKVAPKSKASSRSKKATTSSGAGNAASASTLVEPTGAPIDIPTRTFPASVPLHNSFPLLYRKFPLCGYIDPNAPRNGIPDSAPAGTVSDRMAPSPSGGHWNSPRSAEDLYTPRYVRGVGREKAGLCPICYESPERGGAGKAEWLSMKFSAFNYHMQYAHGISPTTTLPFSPPTAFRLVSRVPNHKNEKSQILEGHCHRCREWAPVEGVKCVEAKLKEIYWWKHAAQCHKGSTLEGEHDAHQEDEIADRVRAVYDAQHQQQSSSSQTPPLFTTTPLF